MNQVSCSIDGCDKPVHARTWCMFHYLRWYRYEDPHGGFRPVGRPPLSSDERFDSKWALDLETGCHVWIKGRDKDGYGKFKLSGKTLRAHIYAFARKYGPVPPGMQLDHFRCDNPPCCNPDHVRPATAWENSARGNGIAAINARKTHCKRGHPFDESNTIIIPKGRACRACARVGQAKYQARRRGFVSGEEGITGLGTAS